MKTENKKEKYINEVIAKNENQLTTRKNITQDLCFLEFQQEDGSLEGYFVNLKNKTIITIDQLIKENCQDHFKEKMNELIKLKYPKFIADVLMKEEVTKKFVLKETQLQIFFDNYQLDTNYQEKLSLVVDYNEIKEDLNISIPLKEEYENENGFDLNKEKKAVALTFDDGPSSEKTRKIMELLEQNKMHATFFMVGNRMNKERTLINELLQKGNEIGSHTYRHTNLFRATDKELEEEQLTNEIYEEITNKPLILMRPPYGNINDKIKEKLNYIYINWNVDPQDWRYKNEEYIYQNVLDHVSDGDIILLHDLYDSTVKAVEKLLPELYIRGFQVVTISELATLKGYTLEKNKVYYSFK